MTKKLHDFTQEYEYGLGFESSDASSYAHVTNENVELEVEPNEVNLTSFNVKDNLVHTIWGENGDLDLKARLALLKISDDFWESCDVRWVKPKTVILTGSICNYNWSEYSDIDLHLVVNFKEIHERVDFVKEYFDEKKNDWNNTHKGLKIHGFPVELYVQNISDEVESGGLYDLYQNKWIRRPDKEEIQPIQDKDKVKELSAKIMTQIDDLSDMFEHEEDKHRIEVISLKLDKLAQKIKLLRTKSLKKNGEMGIGNICYKVLRRTGYLDKMWDLQTKCYDRINSIDESQTFGDKLKMF